MKPTLKPGMTHRFSYQVPENKTVPYTYPESPEIAAMPKVFATGYMIVLMEWVCTQLLAPHLDPGEGTDWAAMVAAARDVRARLGALGLEINATPVRPEEIARLCANMACGLRTKAA